MAPKSYNWKIYASGEGRTGCGCCSGDDIDLELEFEGTEEEVKNYLVGLVASYHNHVRYFRIDKVYVPLIELEETYFDQIQPGKEEFDTRVYAQHDADPRCAKYLAEIMEIARAVEEKRQKEKEAKEKADLAAYERLKAKYEG